MQNKWSAFIIPGILLLSSLSYGQTIKSIEIENSTGGLVISKLTNTQRNQIVNPPAGLMILNTDSGCINYFTPPKWRQLCGDSTLNCNITADCPPGYTCQGLKCIISGGTPCETEEQCPPGMSCVGGFCQ